MRCFGAVWHEKIIKIADELAKKTKSHKIEVPKPQLKAVKTIKCKPRDKDNEPETLTDEFTDYKATNIGLTFDAEYHVQKKARSYWKQYYGEEEDLNLSDVLKDL